MGLVRDLYHPRAGPDFFSHMYLDMREKLKYALHGKAFLLKNVKTGRYMAVHWWNDQDVLEVAGGGVGTPARSAAAIPGGPRGGIAGGGQESGSTNSREGEGSLPTVPPASSSAKPLLHRVHAHSSRQRGAVFEAVPISATSTDLIIALRLIGHEDARKNLLQDTVDGPDSFAFLGTTAKYNSGTTAEEVICANDANDLIAHFRAIVEQDHNGGGEFGDTTQSVRETQVVGFELVGSEGTRGEGPSEGGKHFGSFWTVPVVPERRFLVQDDRLAVVERDGDSGYVSLTDAPDPNGFWWQLEFV